MAGLLNLGSGKAPLAGYVNVDRLPTADVVHDLTRPLPFADNSQDGVFCSHVLEHLSDEHAKALLLEIRRVLKPGAPVRLVVPDYGLAHAWYGQGGQPFFRKGLGIALEGTTAEQKLITWVVRFRHGRYTGGPQIPRELVRDQYKRLDKYHFLAWVKTLVPRPCDELDHQNGFDAAILKNQLHLFAFTRIEALPVSRTHRPDLWSGEAFHNRPLISLYVEATKPYA